MSAAKTARRRAVLRVERTDRSRRAPAPSRATCAVACGLGVLLDELTPPPAPASLELDVSPGAVTVLTGPSGSGKSTLLRDAADAARAAGMRITAFDGVASMRSSEAPCLDQIGLREPAAAAAAMARVGLGDARALAARPQQLSTGQRARFDLARVLLRAERAARSQPMMLALDEFASTLDRASAAALARLTAAWLSRAASRGLDVRAIIATPHERVARELARSASRDGTADRAGGMLIELDAAGRARGVEAVGHGAADDAEVVIDAGSLDDYARLAPLHYRSGPPATIDRVLTARCGATGEVLGVLVTSMPTLNAAWRDYAFVDDAAIGGAAPVRRATSPHATFRRAPGASAVRTGDKAADARWINANLRCISRVIVEPSARSLGVAQRLVRAYLDEPATRFTEAIAAMGRACPFFARAGMTEHPMPRPPQHARLLDALDALGVEPWRLATPRSALARAVDAAEHRGWRGFVERELRSWAKRSRATARYADAPMEEVFRAACRRIASDPVAYLHERPP